MRNALSALALTALVGVSYGLQSAQPAAPAPAIAEYGHFRVPPNAAYKPDPSRDYRIVFSMTEGPKTPGEVNPSLDHVARAVNLYVASGVPLSHLKFVAVAYGEATPIALDNAHYREKFGTDNPNLELIARLRKAGVDVAVCGQAVAAHGYADDWVDKSVTLSLSAMMTITTLQQQGYAFMPM